MRESCSAKVSVASSSGVVRERNVRSERRRYTGRSDSSSCASRTPSIVSLSYNITRNRIFLTPV